MRLMHVAALTAMLTLTAAAHEGHDSTFAPDQWHPQDWTAVRLIDQQDPPTFRQEDDAIAVGPFTAEQKKAYDDNALLMTDTGLADGQIDVTFSAGQSGAPGIFLAPVIEDGVITGGIGVFVARYTMAVWRITVDKENGKTNYEHLARLSDWTEPGEKHVLRCRWSKAGKTIALQVDDRSVLVFRNLPDALDGRVGIWGCHDVSRFYEMKVTTRPTLPWNASAPE